MDAHRLCGGMGLEGGCGLLKMKSGSLDWGKWIDGLREVDGLGKVNGWIVSIGVMKTL